jgi:L-ascorbate metabolism protein UlaG (beta-lactamase superfamily)
MKAPFLADDAFLADVTAARREVGRLHLWWMGQSGFLVAWNGRCVLLDPYLSDSLTRKYAATDKPHVRMTGRVVAPERLDFVDAVTSTHNHTDHLDPETLRALARVNSKLVLVCPLANRGEALERSGLPGDRVVGLDADVPPTSATVAGFEFTAVPAAHEALERDEAGCHRFLGWVVRAGPWTLYHSGDTVLYPGMVERLKPFRVDFALLPINGRGPERRVSGNLWGREAAQVASALGARGVIPCHFDLFEFNTATPDEFVATCGLLGQPFRVLGQGERFSV